MTEEKEVKLILEDSIEFHGTSFGYEKSVSGEIVFNTAMTGYPESMTDPSYKGQVLVLTYPIIGIIRNLLKRDTTVILVPWDWDISEEKFDGLFISNGPGDPKICKKTIESIREVYEKEIPVYGICLGNQLMALAAGADSYKLKYGHRSHNQPVIQTGTNKAYITSQNHGFAINNKTLPDDWIPLFINLNDDTNEGMKHKSKPFFSSQFHPEASGGPTDTEFLFDQFLDLVKKHKK